MYLGEEYKRSFPKLPSGKVLTFKPINATVDTGKSSVQNKVIKKSALDSTFKPTINSHVKRVIEYLPITTALVGALLGVYTLFNSSIFSTNRDSEQYHSALLSFRDFKSPEYKVNKEVRSVEIIPSKISYKVTSRNGFQAPLKAITPSSTSVKVSKENFVVKKKVIEESIIQPIIQPSVSREARKVLSIIKGYGRKDVDSARLAHQIVVESRKSNYDPLFVAAVIKSESAFNALAKSSVGALGLMQIMPGTGNFIHKEFKQFEGKEKKFLTDPGYNIQLGIAYLKYLDELFQGNRVMTLIAYNWGPGHVEMTMRGEKKGIPRPVMNYALKILSDHSKWRRDLYKEESLA